VRRYVLSGVAILVAACGSTYSGPAATAELAADVPSVAPGAASPVPTVVLRTVPPTLVPSATPTVGPVVLPAIAPRSPSPSAMPSQTPSPTPLPTRVPASVSATPRPVATPTPDPITWHGYVIDGGPVMWIPTTWVPIDPAAVKGMFWFAAAASPPSASLAGHDVLVTLNAVRLAAPMTADAFADSWAKVLSGATVTRDRMELRSGPAVLLMYEAPATKGTRSRHVDAIFVVGQRGYTIGFDSPLKDWNENAALLDRMLRLFEPATS
jgi:hypothetical protein